MVARSPQVLPSVSTSFNQSSEAVGPCHTCGDIPSRICIGSAHVAAIAYVREGDTVVVWKLDRLGRNTLNMLETVKAFTDRGVKLVSVTDGIDSSTAAGRMMIGVLGSLAEYERDLTKERTALKRATSRANGTKFGRPRKVQDVQDIATAKRMKEDGHAIKDIAKYLAVSRATLYRYLGGRTAA